MYIPIGGDMAVRSETVVGVFDLDNTTWSKHTRNFLAQAEKEGKVIPVGDELPKSFIVTVEMGMEQVYLIQFSAATMEKRLHKSKKRRNFTWLMKF